MTSAPAGNRMPSSSAAVSAGFTAAVRLGARGYRVTVLEARCSRRPRLHHIISTASPSTPIRPSSRPVPVRGICGRCAGRKLSDDVELRAMDPFYRLHFDNGGDLRLFRTSRLRCAPDRALLGRCGRLYDRLLKASEAIFRASASSSWATGRFPACSTWRASRQTSFGSAACTVYNFVARYIGDERLRTIFSFHPLPIGVIPSLRHRSMCSPFSNANKACIRRSAGRATRLRPGRTSSRAGRHRALQCRGRTDLCRERQGEWRPARRRRNRRADIVVSNACSAWTYLKMLPPECRRVLRDTRRRARYSMSLFVWYFGVDRAYPDVPHHSILFGPRYRELLDDIFVDHRL